MTDLQPNTVALASIIGSVESLDENTDSARVGEISPADEDAYAVAKWNEREDKITRRVGVEREKIEKLVGEEKRSRSMSPSSTGSPNSTRRPESSRLASSSLNGRQLDYEEPAEKFDIVEVVSDSIANTQEPLDTTTEAATTEDHKSTLAIPEDGPPSPTPSTKSAHRRRSSASSQGRAESVSTQLPPPPNILAELHDPQESAEFGDGLGDDEFDDFGEVVEGEDFDDFEGFEEAEPQGDQSTVQPVTPNPGIVLLDMERTEDIQGAVLSAIDRIYPTDGQVQVEPEPVEPGSFFTDRR